MKLLFLLAGFLFAGVVRAQSPVILAQSNNQIVEVGQTATFAVNVTSDGLPVSFQWYRNGTEVAGAVAASVTTPPAQLIDNGTVFFVLVSDELGETASQSIILNVVSPPGAFAMVLNPSNRVTTLGTPVNFTLGVVNPTAQTITLGCTSSAPNSFCLLSDNQIVQGDVTVQILTGQTAAASTRDSLVIGGLTLAVIIGSLFAMPRRILSAALLIAVCMAGCNQMAVVAPAPQPTALTYSFTVTGNISTGIQQVAVGTVTIQSK